MAQHEMNLWIARKGERDALTVHTGGGCWGVFDPRTGEVLAQGEGQALKAQGWVTVGRVTGAPAWSSYGLRTARFLAGVTCYVCEFDLAPGRKKFCDAHGRWAAEVYDAASRDAEGDGSANRRYHERLAPLRAAYVSRTVGRRRAASYARLASAKAALTG